MYIQITTRCNMTCAHCCYGCTAQGEDMTMRVFKAAVAMDTSVSIGGGEPTLHPRFWQMLRHCLASPDVEYVWLATNGGKTEDALALARLAKHGVIGVDLSRDPWHAPIDPRVVKAFTREKQHGYSDRDHNDHRAIRTVTSLIEAGRCDFGDPGCPCSERLVEPSGRIRFCGCADAPVIGHVLTGISEEFVDGEFGECHRQVHARKDTDRLRKSA